MQVWCLCREGFVDFIGEVDVNLSHGEVVAIGNMSGHCATVLLLVSRAPVQVTVFDVTCPLRHWSYLTMSRTVQDLEALYKHHAEVVQHFTSRIPWLGESAITPFSNSTPSYHWFVHVTKPMECWASGCPADCTKVDGPMGEQIDIKVQDTMDRQICIE
jgi:hypothetical protein